MPNIHYQEKPIVPEATITDGWPPALADRILATSRRLDALHIAS
jgi:hypothetical protein